MANKNVLLLVADDLGKLLGSYGSWVQTPHLDQLAAEGTLFTNAFASTASCSGSRSTIYTGMHTHQNGQYGLASYKTHHFTTFDHIDTAPAILSRHGYLTGIIGKIHVGPANVYPYEVREEDDRRDVSWVSDQAASFFTKVKGDKRPFFLTVGYIDPHRDRTRAGWGNQDLFSDRVKVRKYDPATVEIPGYLQDTPGVRQEFANYAESISRLDQGVGLLLAELEKAGLKDDTLIVFVSDNGPPFINSKTTLYDAGISLPLIIRKPGGTPGVKNPNLVSFIDILPTILDFTGAPDKDDQRLGRSVLPILSSTEDLSDWGKVFGSHTFHEVTNYWPTRYIRTRRYKYHRNIAWRLDFPFAADIYGSLTWEDIRNADTNPKKIGGRLLKDYFFRPPEELYDLQEDPNEIKNLAKDPAHAQILGELRTELEAWQRRSYDAWLYRDGISVLFNQYQLDAGLVVPDNWDLDVDRPETNGPDVKAYKNLPFGVDGV